MKTPKPSETTASKQVNAMTTLAAQPSLLQRLRHAAALARQRRAFIIPFWDAPRHWRR